MLREVGTDHRQVRIVNQLVAYKAGQYSRLEFAQSQFLTALCDDVFLQRCVGFVSRNGLAFESRKAICEIVIVEFVVFGINTRVITEHVFDLRNGLQIDHLSLVRVSFNQDRSRFFDVVEKV